MKRRLIVAIALVVAVGVAATWRLRFSSTDGPASAAATTTSTTVQVARRDLVDRQDESGTLGYADPRTVAATARGTVTALPDEGATVDRGGALLQVDAEPVTLLIGDIPLYRELGPGVADGADVRQLESNLVELGRDPQKMTVDDHFDAETTAAVKELQRHLGTEQTGVVVGARFVVLPAPIRIGTRKVTVGGAVGPGTPVYAATSTVRVAGVDVPVADISTVTEKSAATIDLPDGRTTAGTVTDIGSTAHPKGSGADVESVITVIVTLRDQKATVGMDAAPVDVHFTKAVKKGVLAVPVTALVALAEGGYAVQTPDGSVPGGRRLVAVTTGLYADGLVEISGAGVTAGMSVLVPV